MARVTELREHLDGRRTWDARATIDVAEMRSDGSLQIRGIASVFDSDSEPLYGMFVEQVKRGAFRKVLKAQPDVRLLFNHDGMPMARTSNGTLRLREDAKGLAYDADLADTTLARDIHTLVERGDLNQMSFAFTVAHDEWERTCSCRESHCGCLERRYIHEIGELFEVSVVTFPAYQATSAEVSRNEVPEKQECRGGSEQQTDDSGDSTDSSTQQDANATAHAIKARAASIRPTRSNNEFGTQGGPRHRGKAPQ